MTVTGGVAPFLELADPEFSVTAAEVHEAREACWYARTSYGIAVLRHDHASRLISHPSVRQGSSAWPAHHGITSGPFADWWANWVLNKEGPDHRRLRKLLNPAFSRRLVEAMGGQLLAEHSQLGGLALRFRLPRSARGSTLESAPAPERPAASPSERP